MTKGAVNRFGKLLSALNFASGGKAFEDSGVLVHLQQHQKGLLITIF